jgi:hypothetical protein
MRASYRDPVTGWLVRQLCPIVLPASIRLAGEAGIDLYPVDPQPRSWLALGLIL